MKLVSVDKLIDCKFLKLYKLNLLNKNDVKRNYFVASRREEEMLTCKTRDHSKADAVMVIPITEDNEFVILKQFRPAINDYIYEFPAGLIDAGEDIDTAAKRELYEETGLSSISMEMIVKPSYTSVGMTDESIAVVKAIVQGEISNANAEEDEEIEIIKIKREDMTNFIKEKNVSIKTALAVLAV